MADTDRSKSSGGSDVDMKPYADSEEKVWNRQELDYEAFRLGGLARC